MRDFLGFPLSGDGGICVAAGYYVVSNILMDLQTINHYFVLACGFR